jgi:hypothetical protein
MAGVIFGELLKARFSTVQFKGTTHLIFTFLCKTKQKSVSPIKSVLELKWQKACSVYLKS